jgi:hypothetical protein
LFEGWVVGSEVLVEHVQLSFSFLNKFTIRIPCDLLEENNTFSKMGVLKVLPTTSIMVIMNTEMRIFDNNRIRANEQLMLVILNCTLLHDQNDGLTVPYPYLMVCFKNSYLRMFKKLI